MINRRLFLAGTGAVLLVAPFAAEGRPKRAGSVARRFRYNRAAAMQGTWVPLAGDLSVPRSLPEFQWRQVEKQDI